MSGCSEILCDFRYSLYATNVWPNRETHSTADETITQPPDTPAKACALHWTGTFACCSVPKSEGRGISDVYDKAMMCCVMACYSS